MPKERSDRSGRSRASPYPCGSSLSRVSLTQKPLEYEENVKEWELVRCAVCMEHPHNALLLICSSHDKGCRPFMCDTSYRHSNCFDQFCKSSAKTPQTVLQQEGAPVSIAQPSSYVAVPEATVTNTRAELSREGYTRMHVNFENQVKGKLVCPLCRGDINGWIVVEPARVFLNSKSRNCASETCVFSGTYAELRKHARLVHPEVRPTKVDPERQRDWRRLERERDIGDLISTLRSPPIGEERSEEGSEESSEDGTLAFEGNGWLTVFMLIRVLQPRGSSRSSGWLGSPGVGARVRLRRRPITRLWGHSNDRDRDTESSDGGSGLRIPESSDGGSGPRSSRSSGWLGSPGVGARVPLSRRPITRLWGHSNDRDRDTESSDGGSGLRIPESSDGGSGPRSEQIRRQPTPRQQTPDES